MTLDEVLPDRAGPVLAALRDSLSLKIALAGLLLILAGFAIREGAIPGFMVIWGTLLLLVGSGSYIAIQRSRR